MDEDKSALKAAFGYVTTLFFAWGFVTATIDPLVPIVRSVFSLSYAQSMLTQFAFFLAYGIVSLPAAGLVARRGFAQSIIIALAAMAAGCLIIPLATQVDRYALVLVALFIVASGITLLQVAANPLAAALGRQDRSHYRLTLSQAFNSLGTVLAPYVGAALLLHGGLFAVTAHSVRPDDSRAESLRHIDAAFLIMALLITALAWFLWRARQWINAAAPPVKATCASPLTAFCSGWAVLGGIAIFLYVGAEVSIGSIMISFLEQPRVLAVKAETAGRLLSLYWLGAMVGRFLGSVCLTRINAGWLLTSVACAAGLLCLIVSQSRGVTAATAALAVGLCNAVMFPTIFTLTLERSAASAAATSGLLCMAIVGGAVLPVLVGHIADVAGLGAAFLVPMASYCGIAVFALAPVGKRAARLAGRVRLSE